MAGKSYDEEDRRLARVIFCRPDYKNRQWLLEQMRQEDPERYETLQPVTVAKWKVRDREIGIDWDELKRQKQVQRAEREGTLAVNTAEELQTKMLTDMLGVLDLLRKVLQREGVIRKVVGEDGEEKEIVKIEFIPECKRLLDAYTKAHDRALKLVQGKIKDVDLNRLSKENQIFFMRRLFEDVGLVAGEIDEDFGLAWKKNVKAVLARLRGPYSDEVITEAQDDLCLDTIIARKRELDARRSSQGNTDQGATPGVHGAETGTD